MLHRSTHVGASAALTLLPALLMTAVASAQVASALLHEGGPLPGVPGETVMFINTPDVNNIGGYAVSVNTTGTGTTLSRAFGNATGGTGAVILTEATYGNLEQTSWESFIGLSDAGGIAYSPSVTDLGSGTTGIDSVWLDTTPILAEGDPIAQLPGQFSTFNSRPGLTADGQPWWIGGISNSPGGGTQSRVLFFGTDATPKLRAGDTLSGVPEPVATGSAIDFDAHFSAMGSNFIVPANVVAASTVDTVIVINGAAAMAGGSVVRQGSPVPASAGGLPGETWQNFDLSSITESGVWFLTGDTSQAIGFDEFVFTDGAIALREGDSLSLGPTMVTVAGAIESGAMNEDGDWAVTWDIDATSGNIEALIVNGAIALVEGDAVDWNGDGVIDAADDGAVLTDFSGISTVRVGRRDGGVSRVYFTADVELTGGAVLEGFFCLPVAAGNPCPEDLSGNGQVDFADILAVIAAWGPCAACPEDLSGNGQVDFADILLVIAAWGPCPT